MGCDIHCHIEVKINGRWEHYSAPNIDRDYTLFTRMAGVRARDVPTMVQPRGMVPDPSIVTEIDWTIGDGDWHTPSWFTGAELESLIRERTPPPLRGGFGYLFGNDFDVKGPDVGPGEYPDGVEDCRLVFWFDN